MEISEALKSGGFKAEKSTAGDKQILKGVYKCMFVDFQNQPEGKYGPQLMAKFQITEKLSGMDSRSTFPQFTGYYSTDAEKALSKRSGIAKLLNGFFSVGITVETSSDEKLMESLSNLKGSAEVYISGYKKSPKKNTGTKENPEWVDNPDGEDKQDFTFMTQKNAEREAAKQIKKDGHPL